MKSSIGSLVSEILTVRQKTLLLFIINLKWNVKIKYILVVTCKISFLWHILTICKIQYFLFQHLCFLMRWIFICVRFTPYLSWITIRFINTFSRRWLKNSRNWVVQTSIFPLFSTKSLTLTDLAPIPTLDNYYKLGDLKTLGILI